MRSIRNWMVFILVAVMLMGCGSNNSNDDVSSETKEKEQATSETKNEEPAASKDEEAVAEKEREHVTITWYQRQSEPANVESVMTKVNEILNEKLNTSLEIKYVEPSEWREKMPLLFAAGEEFDLIWTAGWGGFNYAPGVSQGVFKEIDDLLKDNGAEILENYPKYLWDGVRVDGKIYGIPNYQITYQQKGFIVRKDLVEKYDIDVESLKTKEGMMAAFKVVKEGEDIYPLVSGLNIGYSLYEKSNNDKGIFRGPNFWEIDTNDWKVLTGSDQDPANEFYALSRELYENGYITPDSITIKDKNKEFGTGNYFMHPANYKPGASADYTAKYGFEVIAFPTGNPISTTKSMTSSMTAVSMTSQNPDRAVELVNFIHTDKEIYNLLIFGIEGQDYNMTAENHIEKVEGGYSVPAWKVGNQFNAYLLPGQEDDVWEQTMALNEQAIVSPLLGFNFDNSNVQIEAANVKAVVGEFDPIRQNGAMDFDEMLAEFSSKVEQAGQEALIAEYQKQLDAWMANR